MAKRKVKRKAPKRKRKVVKRKVVKRKRKAPKRRRKRKFGMAAMAAKAKAKALELAKKAKEAVGGAKTTFIDLGGKQILPLLVPLVDFENVKKKLKNDSQKKIANDIEGKIKTDLGAGDLDLKGTISYFKETAKGQGEEAKKKAEELKETFYTMIQEKQIYKKLEQQVNKAFEKVPAPVKMAATTLKVELNYTGFLSILKKVYTDSKDVSKKLSFNILGSLLSKTPTESDYKKNLITDIKAAGTAAIEAAKTEIDKKVSGEPKPPPPPEAKGEEPKKEITKEQTEQALSKSADAAAAKGKKRQEEVKKIEFKGVADFGKSKKGPSVSLKKLCKKHGVRLMVKRGKKRVYKSSKVLKEQCKKKLKNKLKKNKKKNFGKKKIKRSSIMPKAKRSYGRSKRKRSRRSTSSRALARAKAFAKKYRYPLGAAATAAGLYGLGKGYDRFAPDTWVRPQFPLTYSDRDTDYNLHGLSGRAGLYQTIEDAEGKESEAFRPFIGGGFDSARISKPKSLWDMIPGFRKPYYFKKSTKAPKKNEGAGSYGKRRRRRKKRSFGKKAKKPSAALRRMCKRLKVKTTLKRGKKRVYKSEAMLKKQCRKAKKRKAKKSKK